MDAQSAQPMRHSPIVLENNSLRTLTLGRMVAPAPPRRSILGSLLYRFGLVMTGITWVCIASTLCGCAPLSGWVMNSSGRGYYKYGHYTAARFEFERALMDQPCNPSYAHNLAKALAKEGNFGRAEQVYQYALRIDPAHQPSYSGLSELLMLQGRHGDATQLLTAWAETQPYNPAAQMELARIHRQTGDFTGAEQRLFQAYRISPYDPYVAEQLGALYQETGRPQQAAMLYHQSLAVNPFQADVAARLSSLTPQQRPSPMSMAQSTPFPYYQSPGIHNGMMHGGQPAAYMTHGPVPAGQMAHAPTSQHLPMMGFVPPEASMGVHPATNAPMTASAGVGSHGWSPAPSVAHSGALPLQVQHASPAPSGLPQGGPQHYGPHGPHMHGPQHMHGPHMHSPQHMHGPSVSGPSVPPQFVPHQGVTGPHGIQPVELGSPTPVTHRHQSGTPMMGAQIPTVNAF